MKHLTAKPCPRCSLTLQRSPLPLKIQTRQEYNGAPTVRNHRIHVHAAFSSNSNPFYYVVTCPTRRAMLLSNPTFLVQMTPQLFYSVLYKDGLGAQKRVCCVFGGSEVGCEGFDVQRGEGVKENGEQFFPFLIQSSVIQTLQLFNRH
ncbi:hypothetical protein XENORESO_013699 [Xenotaenia resolanae]|uniref:Uncharacterized protein n=1 Tax=Xenotaenia resolanae TaxID=208358 RepID=A0ABV0VUJ0_9TELE